MSAADSILSIYHTFLSPESRIPSDMAPPFIPAKSLSCLLEATLDVLSHSSALVAVTSPINIVGDLHGSIVDLLRILNHFGLPPMSRYLFLGDYIDRGRDSIGVLSLVLALKCKWPNDIFLLRGNHEFTHVNETYGFRGEMLERYADDSIWQTCQAIFTWLPLVAIVDSSIFCVHGGISPLFVDLGQLESLKMPIVSYNQNSMVADIVWSNPVEGLCGFRPMRSGSGQMFGADRVEAFLSATGLRLMVRGHACAGNRYESFARGMGITVFSAGDSCQLSVKESVVLQVCGNDIDIVQIDARTGKVATPESWQLSDGRIGATSGPPKRATPAVVQVDSGFSMCIEADCGQKKRFADWESLRSTARKGKRKETFHL
jgi:diadenosine tetraphosphatase ApaH/serine/threonine PP2A family protein phosphatase